MASNPTAGGPNSAPASAPAPASGNASRQKPWERASASSGPTPFRPPSAGGTVETVQASGTAKPGEITSTSTVPTTNMLSRSVPPRPWEQSYGGTYGGTGYGTGMNYNSGYGYNSGGYMSGSSYGSNYGGLHNSSMYNRGGMYGGSGPYGSGMYGGGMNGGGYGTGGLGGYGMGMGGPYGNQDPNNPFGAPQPPPGFWMSFLQAMHGVVNFFGRISVLIDQNTQAFHLFMSAMLQLFDRSGMLYGELARFVFRLLGIKTKSRNPQQVGGPAGQLPGPDGQGQQYLEGPKAADGRWDNVWGDDGNKTM